MTEYNFRHLRNRPLSAIQTDEALFLYALIRVLNPKIIVEFGFGEGYSSVNFLKAMPEDCRLFSYDPSPLKPKAIKKIKDKRFIFISKRGEDFKPKDVNNALIDVVFFDASHSFDTDVGIFKAVKKSLSDECLIIVHDTGIFNEKFKRFPWRTENGIFLGRNEYVHQPHERMFVNYLKAKHLSLEKVDFHSMYAGRMGLTILQRSKKLKVGRMESEYLKCLIKKTLKEIFKRMLHSF